MLTFWRWFRLVVEGRLCWPAGKRSLTVCGAVSFDPVRPSLSCHHSALPPACLVPACLPALHRPLAPQCEAILVTKHYAGRGHPPFPPWSHSPARSGNEEPAAAGSLRSAGWNLLSFLISFACLQRKLTWHLSWIWHLALLSSWRYLSCWNSTTFCAQREALSSMSFLHAILTFLRAHLPMTILVDFNWGRISALLYDKAEWFTCAEYEWKRGGWEEKFLTLKSPNPSHEMHT